MDQDNIRIARKVNVAFCSIAIVCNVLAMVAMRLGVKELRAKHRFVTSLNMADVLVALISLIQELIELNEITWCDLGDAMFGLLFTGYLVMGSSLVCIALDLYIALCHPLRYDVIMTSKMVSILLVASWACSVLCGLSYLVCRAQVMVLRGQDFCKIQRIGMCNLYLGIFGTYGSLCAASLTVFYLRVQWTVWRMSRSVQPLSTTEYSGQRSANTESTMKAFLTIWMVAFTMVIFLLPGYVVVFFTTSDFADLALVLRIASDWATLNCIADPLIYSFRMTELRNGFKKMFTFMKRA